MIGYCQTVLHRASSASGCVLRFLGGSRSLSDIRSQEAMHFASEMTGITELLSSSSMNRSSLQKLLFLPFILWNRIPPGENGFAHLDEGFQNGRHKQFSLKPCLACIFAMLWQGTDLDKGFEPLENTLYLPPSAIDTHEFMGTELISRNGGEYESVIGKLERSVRHRIAPLSGMFARLFLPMKKQTM